VPDADTRETMVIRTIQKYQLTVNFTNNPQGLFSFAVQPILGDPGQINTYQMACVNANISWGTNNQTQLDFTLPANYVSTFQNLLPGGSTDPRTDNAMPVLSQQLPGYLSVVGNTLLTKGTPFGQTPLVNTTSYGVGIQYGFAVSSVFTLPAGVWEVGVVIIGSGFTAAPSVAVFNPSRLSTITSGFSADGTVCWGFYVISLASGSVSGQNLQEFAIDCFGAAAAVTGSTGTFKPVMITPTVGNGLFVWENSGQIAQMRPVAQGVNFSNSLPDLYAGGKIAINWIPGNVCTAQFFSNSTTMSASTIGQLQFFSNLAETERAYDGNFKKGAHCWWAPGGKQDLLFRDPNSTNLHEFPCVICSGFANPASTITGPQTLGEISIITVYEIQTLSNIWPQMPCTGDDSILDHALKFCAVQKHGMENPSHWLWIAAVMQKAWVYVRDVGDWLFEERENKALSVAADSGSTSNVPGPLSKVFLSPQ
jgi:hypothetical protein